MTLEERLVRESRGVVKAQNFAQILPRDMHPLARFLRARQTFAQLHDQGRVEKAKPNPRQKGRHIELAEVRAAAKRDPRLFVEKEVEIEFRQTRADDRFVRYQGVPKTTARRTFEIRTAQKMHEHVADDFGEFTRVALKKHFVLIGLVEGRLLGRILRFSLHPKVFRMQIQRSVLCHVR